MPELLFSDRALGQIKELEKEHARRVINKLEEAVEWPNHYLEPLTGVPYHKVRAGDYRAIVRWEREEDTITVRAVGHRRNIYDREL